MQYTLGSGTSTVAAADFNCTFGKSDTHIHGNLYITILHCRMVFFKSLYEIYIYVDGPKGKVFDLLISHVKRGTWKLTGTGNASHTTIPLTNIP